MANGKKRKSPHEDLSRRFRSIGGNTRWTIPRGYRPLPDPAGHRPDIFLRTLARQSPGARSGSHFSRAYRDSLPRHDEILSTASVREIVNGVMEARARRSLTAAETRAVNTAVNDVSRVRMRTAHVGYATATESMQHPTAVDEAVFAHPHQTAGSHFAHDLQRRKEAADEAEAESLRPGANIVSVTRAALRAALLYTLNEMTVAATASDVSPFTRVRSWRKKVAQKDDRERLKDALIQVGGQVEAADPNEVTADDRITRVSRTTRGKRSASPFRR